MTTFYECIIINKGKKSIKSCATNYKKPPNQKLWWPKFKYFQLTAKFEATAFNRQLSTVNRQLLLIIVKNISSRLILTGFISRRPQLFLKTTDVISLAISTSFFDSTV